MAKSSEFLSPVPSTPGNLSPADTEMVQKLLSSPADLPPAFLGWLRDWIAQEVVPAIVGRQIKGVPQGCAPDGATYVTISSNSILDGERTLTAGEDISVTDGGANSPVTLAVTPGVRHRKLTLVPTSATAAVTATSAVDMYALDATSAAFTVTLPAAASHTGRVIVLKKIDSTANAVTIDANASETIDGALTQLMYHQYEQMKIVCDGSNWHIINWDIPLAFCDVTHSANQSISTATPTVLAFDTETSDTTAMHDTVTNNSRITVRRPGVYGIHGNVQWAASAVGHRHLEFLLNGATVLESLLEDAPGGGHDINQQIVSYKRLAAGDYVELRVTQDSGGALNVLTGTNVPHLEVVWLGR